MDSLLNKWDQPESDDRLELVFEDRFKGYGAYMVRLKYRQAKFIATVVACCFVVLLTATPVILAKFKDKKDSGSKKVRIEAKTLEDAEEKEEEKPLEPIKPEKPEPIAQQQYVAPQIDENTKNEAEFPPPSQVKNPGQTTVTGNDTEYGDDGSSGKNPFGDDDGNSDKTLSRVDVEAKFPGGDQKFIEYVQANFQYPLRCQEEGINGAVLLRFVVDGKGAISNITVLEETKSCTEFTAEAIRVLKRSPRWIPAQYNGKFVKAWRQIPIKLSIE